MNRQVRHPSLYEINIRVLLNEFQTGRKRMTLSKIPDEYWKGLKDLGMDWVWLMGIWTIREKMHDPNLIPEPMMTEFKELLPDLHDDDICGSTFAVDDYEVDPLIGGKRELVNLRKKLNGLGLNLMLDFIPNHYGANSRWLKTHPEYFIEVGEAAFKIDQETFYSPFTTNDKYFAHGKDPYFAAWQDTIQIDYAFEGTRSWMTNQLLRVARLCDGVRCDMAMLPVRRIFQQTWGSYVKWDDNQEFWPTAIETVKQTFPDFLMLAEVYWDMESELLNMGFDYCYDKTFYDRILNATQLNAHFKADTWYLDRTTRFLENHDEERIASRIGLKQHMAAAALVAMGPGMRFWHMGQFEGKTGKTPVQLSREPVESCGCIMWSGTESGCYCTRQIYKSLLELTNSLDPLKNGTWQRLNTTEEVYSDLFLWQWTTESIQITIAVNYGQSEVKLRPEELGVSKRIFHKQLFPSAEDSYAGMRMKPWAVKVWQGK